MIWFHPTRNTLASWYEGQPLPKVDNHLRTCNRCAARLENLAEPAPDLRRALADAFRPRPHLVPRLQGEMRTRLENRQDLQLLAGMLGLSWQTSRVLFTEEPE